MKLAQSKGIHAVGLQNPVEQFVDDQCPQRVLFLSVCVESRDRDSIEPRCAFPRIWGEHNWLRSGHDHVLRVPALTDTGTEQRTEGVADPPGGDGGN